jgi:anti-sigma factor RsiW
MFAELSNYLDDELDDSLCEELEKHMDGCEPCKAFLSTLEKSIRQCRMAQNEPPDPRVAAKLRRELLAEYQGLMSKITRRGALEVNRS